MRSAALWNFLAGTSAAAGTTLLTAIPAGTEKGASAVKLAVSSGPWLLLALALAYTAAQIDKAQREIDLRTTRNLKPEEVREIQRNVLRALHPRTRLLLRLCDIGSVAFLVLGVVLLTWLYR